MFKNFEFTPSAPISEEHKLFFAENLHNWSPDRLIRAEIVAPSNSAEQIPTTVV